MKKSAFQIVCAVIGMASILRGCSGNGDPMPSYQETASLPTGASVSFCKVYESAFFRLQNENRCNKPPFPRITRMTGDREAYVQRSDDNRICTGKGAA